MAERDDKFRAAAETVERWLNQIEAAVQRGQGRHAFTATMKLHGEPFTAFIVPLQSGVAMLFETGVQVTAAQFHLAAGLIADVNDRVPFGNFELNGRTRIIFKVSTFVDPSDSEAPKYLSRCAAGAAFHIARYLPSIKNALAGKLDPNDVVKTAERDASAKIPSQRSTSS